jgi:putative ABC transport system permease protein
MNFSRLIRLLVFRTIKEEKLLTILSVIGVALGIGLFIGVRAASDRAVDAFEADIRGINPRVSHVIVDSAGLDFSDSVYASVRSIEDDSFPVLRATGYLSGSIKAIEIRGVYTVRIEGFLGTKPGERFDMEDYFRERNGVLVTQKFAGKHGLQKGDAFEASVYDRVYSLKIADILESERLPTDMAIMDLGNFQDYFARVGYLTRIDLVTDEVRAREIEEILPPHLSMQKIDRLIENQKGVVTSFRYNLLFVSLIAVLVGMFLLYNTVFVSVVKRRTEIGILRGLGIGRRTVMALFTVQGLILGFAGSLAGIVLGQFFAYFSIAAVERTMSTIYGGVSIPDFILTWKDGLGSLIVGLSVSLAASLIPSYESSKIKPNEAIGEGSFEVKYAGYQRSFSLVGFLCILGGGVFSYIDYRMPPFDFPYLAYAGVLLFIIGCTLLSPLYLRAVLHLAKSPVTRFFKGTGRVAVGDIGGSIFRFSVALMSVAISSALVFALVTSIFSLRSSLRDWIDRNITADVYIKPASCVSNYCFFPLSNDVEKIVRGYPEVAAMDRFRVLNVDLFGKNVVAGFGETGNLRRYGNKKYIGEGDQKRLKRLEEEKEVSISDYLGIRYGLKKGDVIELQTPKGKEQFTINNTFISYSTTSGFVYLDRRWLRELWGIDDATQVSVYLEEGVDAGKFAGKLKKRLLKDYSLEIMNNRELRERILAIFNRSFTITYAIELIAIIVSLIGMINALLILVLEKKREMSIIRYLGGSWTQIRNMIVLSAGIIGLTGIFLGTIMGPAISMVIIHVINRLSFGWDVSFRIPLLPLSILTVILFLTSLSAGYLPSKVARRVDPKAYISFE